MSVRGRARGAIAHFPVPRNDVIAVERTENVVNLIEKLPGEQVGCNRTGDEIAQAFWVDGPGPGS